MPHEWVKLSKSSDFDILKSPPTMYFFIMTLKNKILKGSLQKKKRLNLGIVPKLPETHPP